MKSMTNPSIHYPRILTRIQVNTNVSLSLFLRFKYTAEEDALYEDEASFDHMRNDEDKTQWKISIEKIKENYEAYEAKSKCSNNNNEVYQIKYVLHLNIPDFII